MRVCEDNAYQTLFSLPARGPGYEATLAAHHGYTPTPTPTPTHPAIFSIEHLAASSFNAVIFGLARKLSNDLIFHLLIFTKFKSHFFANQFNQVYI